MSSAGIGAWKPKPSGGMAPGPGGDRPTTYDVFVGNLPEQSDDAELYSLFAKYGEINSTVVLAGKRGDGRQIGFVRFVSESDALSACQDTGHMINGCPITVRRANKKTGGSQSGGGSTGGGDGTGRKMDRRPPTGGYGVGLLDHQTSPVDKPDQGFNHKPRGGGTNVPHAPTAAVPLKEDKVMVTHIDSPTCFWAQVVDGQIELLQITENLVAVCPSATALMGQPVVEKVYATKFSEDQDWYRCKVVKYISDSQSEVQYIDYGNGEVVQNAAIVELPPSVANIRPQASKYVLYGLKPYSYDTQSIGHEQGVRTLGELTNGKLLSGKMYYGPKLGPIPVILEDGDIDINQEMLNAGFGEKRFTVQHGSGKPGGYPGAERQGKWPTDPSRKSPPSQSGMETFSRMGTFNEKDIARSTAPPSGWGEMKQMPQEIGQLQIELQKTKRELYELQARNQMASVVDLNLLQREKNSFIMELATTRGKLKTLEQDYIQMAAKLQEANLQYKMVNLLAGVNKVKQLRKQFPTDSQTPDNIQRAIDLVSSAHDRISVTSLNVITELEAVMSHYNAAQDDIRACTDLESLPGLVTTRDTQRVEVYDKIVQFLETIHSLPLESRAAQLKETVLYLEMTHASFLKADIANPLGLEEALDAYREWKVNKEADFQDVRTETNTRHNAVISSLRLVQQQLSLEVVNMPDSPPATMANLDQLLAKLQTAMMKEIEKTDIQRDSESGFITIVLKTLIAQVKCELADIVQLETLRLEYLGLQMQLGHWLVEQPSVSELKAVRQTIKALKSRLRHTLADKQDAEESDDSRSDELTSINTELSKIRNQLQAAFTQESELMSEIAELNERHFPELALQYPEFNIDNEVKYGGLLKLSHTLEQYDVEPLPSCSKKSIMKSSHCDKPVVIKEYIIDDGGGQKMGEFMRRAMAYNSVVNEHLVPLQDIFFGKNERHAYVQLPYYAKSLTSLVEERHRLSDKEIYRVLVGVLKGLRALHDMRLIHGVLHPNNVFLDDNDNTCIAEFDFTKTLKQRAERVFTTSTGLVFAAPEGATNSNHCSDMFNFGLLMLWLYFPEVHFNLNSKGIPDISCVGISEELSTIIYNLRSENPVERFTAFDLLNDPYFMTPPETLPRHVANPEEDVIQLRSRSPTDRDRTSAGGILKNSTTSVSTEATDPTVDAAREVQQTSSQDEKVGTIPPPLDGASGDDTSVSDLEVETENLTGDDHNVIVRNGDLVSGQSGVDASAGLQLDIPDISVQPPTPTPTSPVHRPTIDTDAVSPDSLPDLDEILRVAINGDMDGDTIDVSVDVMQMMAGCHTAVTDDTVESGDTSEASQVAQKLIQTYEELPIDP